jgi:hypothetical protein
MPDMFNINTNTGTGSANIAVTPVPRPAIQGTVELLGQRAQQISYDIENLEASLNRLYRIITPKTESAKPPQVAPETIEDKLCEVSGILYENQTRLQDLISYLNSKI